MWLHCETNGCFVVLLYINIDDFDILKRLISLVNLNVLDGMDDFKPSNCPAKDGVLAVQPGSRSGSNKPLGTVAVWLAWIRHGHCVWTGRREGLVWRAKGQRELWEKGAERTYRSCFKSRWNSSSSSSPQIDSPPVPSPSGSPVWIIYPT